MFQITPEGLIEKAKVLFMSEEFHVGFDLIRTNFESELTDQQIFQLLKGEIGYSFQGNDVFFDVSLIDEEYSSQIKEILANYDNLICIDEELYEAKEFIDYNLLDFADTSDFVKYLNSNSETLIKIKDFPYLKAMLKYDFHSFDFADYFYYNKNGIYFFQEFSKANIEEVCVVKDSIIDVINTFDVRGY